MTDHDVILLVEDIVCESRTTTEVWIPCGADVEKDKVCPV